MNLSIQPAVPRARTIENLKAALALIPNESAWVKHMRRGLRVDNRVYTAWPEESANCYCAEGAIQEATAFLKEQEAAEAAIVETISEPFCLWRFNDRPGTTYENVCEAFTLTIARLEALP